MTDANTDNQPESAGGEAASFDSNGSMTLNTGTPQAPAPTNPIVGGEKGAQSAKTISEVIQEKIDATAEGKKPAKAAAEKTATEKTDATKTDATAPVVTADGKPAYVPNYKYKVAGQEKELDPFWHSVVKDAESEKKVKELLTKVDAFDFVKGKQVHYEQQFNQVSGDYEALNGTVARFDQAVAKDDLSSAFRLAGIPKEKIFQWVHKQLQFESLPPEQKAAIQEAEEARNQTSDYETKLSQMEQKYQTQAVQARTMQLDMVLLKPEISQFANAWDQNAEPGNTFRDTVANEARRVYYDSLNSGQGPIDLSPEQAVAMVMKRFGKFVSVGEPTAAQSPQAASQTVIQTQKGTPPVIPNVQGKSASPIKKAFKSLDELRAHEKSMPG